MPPRLRVKRTAAALAATALLSLFVLAQVVVRKDAGNNALGAEGHSHSSADQHSMLRRRSVGTSGWIGDTGRSVSRAFRRLVSSTGTSGSWGTEQNTDHSKPHPYFTDDEDSIISPQVQEQSGETRQQHHHHHAWHKPLHPIDGWDISGVGLACIGLMIAAAGGIGGGGILVPLYILVLQFHPKHAIPLSNITIFGGAITNTVLNMSKRHPDADRPLVDWDLILVMEPLTIGGALVGSFINKVAVVVVVTSCGGSCPRSLLRSVLHCISGTVTQLCRHA